MVAMCITCDVKIDTNESSKGANACSGRSFCLQLPVVAARRRIGENPSEDFQKNTEPVDDIIILSINMPFDDDCDDVFEDDEKKESDKAGDRRERESNNPIPSLNQRKKLRRKLLQRMINRVI